MDENKSTVEEKNIIEDKSTTEEKKNTEVKKNDWKKYIDKKYWKIYIAIFVALAAIITVIVWLCVAGGNNDEPDEPPEPEVYAEITAADISKYTLICASRSANSVMTQYWLLQSQIKDMYGKQPLAETDYIDATEFEILVGNTNREESKAFLSGLLWDDYGYAIVGNKLVVAGHTPEGTLNAIKHLLEHLKSGDHTSVFFTNKNQYLYRYPYVSDTFMLNGVDVSRAKIVVNEEGTKKQYAQILSDKSLELCGRRPAIVTDAEVEEGDSLIIIGASTYVPADMQADWNDAQQTVKGQFSYYINNTENTVWINTEVLEGYSAMNRDIIPQIQSNQTANIVLTTGLVKVPQLFSVMSFNVYVGEHSTARMERVTDTILENAPSAFGVQEADVLWMTTLKNELGDIYTSVGVGRDWGGLGEHSAIFYRTDLFNCIESGTKWLSNTPDQAGSYYTYKDPQTGTTHRANFPRVMTYVLLERKNDGARFLYVNTHLDHDGNNGIEIGEQVRQGQIEILIAEIQKLGNLPTIVTGDFNVTPEASAYTTMIGAGFLDSSKVAKEGEIKSTYNGMDNNYAGAIIDYIFVSPELAESVDTYTVCPAKRDGQWVSDHNAIIATITLPTTERQE